MEEGTKRNLMNTPVILKSEEREKGPSESLEVTTEGMELSLVSVREVIDSFNSSRDAVSGVHPYVEGGSWDMMENEQKELERKIMQFVFENPGKSYNAILKHFKSEGLAHTTILEAYNVLLYEKKILKRLNVGTLASPRYAHFAVELQEREPKKDALYDVLGPM